MFRKKPKKDGESGIKRAEMSIRIISVDESQLDFTNMKFLADVREHTDRFSAVELMSLDVNQRLFFLEDLKYGTRTSLDLEKPAVSQEPMAVIKPEPERKELAAGSEQIDVAKTVVKVLSTDETCHHPALEIECNDEDFPGSSQENSSSSLIHDPAQRQKRSVENMRLVLDWLRQEPYSTVEILSLVLRMSVPGARKVLNKFVRDGWLVRDEVPWVGVPGKLHLFGISSKGLYHLLDPDDVEPSPNRDFKRGRAKASTGNHILNIQLARLYLQRYKNPDYKFRRYTAARDLPFFGGKHYRWATYPDAVLEDSHVNWKHRPGCNLKIAIEIEQHGKGSKRYRSLIQSHVDNIDDKTDDPDLSNRYDLVFYYLPDETIAANLKRLFHALIDNLYDDEGLARSIKNRFRFYTYSTLAERIRELG